MTNENKLPKNYTKEFALKAKIRIRRRAERKEKKIARQQWRRQGLLQWLQLVLLLCVHRQKFDRHHIQDRRSHIDLRPALFHQLHVEAAAQRHLHPSSRLSLLAAGVSGGAKDRERMELLIHDDVSFFTQIYRFLFQNLHTDQ